MFVRDYDIMLLFGKMTRAFQLLVDGVKKINRSQIDLFKFLEDENNTNAMMRLLMTTVPFLKLEYEAGWFFHIAERALGHDYDGLFLELQEIRDFFIQVKKATEILNKEAPMCLSPYKLDLEIFLGENLYVKNIRKLADDLGMREMTPQELIIFYFQYEDLPRSEKLLVSLNPVNIFKNIDSAFLTVENTETTATRFGGTNSPHFVRAIKYCPEESIIRREIKSIILVKK